MHQRIECSDEESGPTPFFFLMMPEGLFLFSHRVAFFSREDRLIFFAKERHDIPVPHAHKDFEREWNIDAALPDMWEIMHQCESAALDIYNTETIINWYVFLKKNNAATLEEFLQEFVEGAKDRDFYKFSKYCIALYRKVHEEQLAVEKDPLWRAFIEKRMAGAVRRDQLGDQYHEDPENKYWQERASIVGPDYRELPRPYVKLRDDYVSFGEFMVAHKEFDQVNEGPKAKIAASRRRIARKVHGALGK